MKNDLHLVCPHCQSINRVPTAKLSVGGARKVPISPLPSSPDRTIPAIALEDLTYINRPAGRWMLTLDLWHVRCNTLQSLARISLSEAA